MRYRACLYAAVGALALVLLAGKAGASVVGEDCILIDPQRHEVVADEAGFLIAHGGHRLMLLEREEEARRALAIMRHYGMNLSCYVGRPDASMHYFLVDEQAPIGAMEEEQCLAVDRDSLAMVELEGEWFLADDDRRLLAFGDVRHEALLALAIIKQHAFDYQCHVGDPAKASMTYFRRREMQ